MENARLCRAASDLTLDERIFAPGIPISPSRRRARAGHVRSELKAVRAASVLCSFSIDPHTAAFPQRQTTRTR